MSRIFSYAMHLGARDGETSTTLSRGDSIGLAFDTFAGFISAVASAIILVVIFVSLGFFFMHSLY
jgi:hypothetical protein